MPDELVLFWGRKRGGRSTPKVGFKGDGFFSATTYTLAMRVEEGLTLSLGHLIEAMQSASPFSSPPLVSRESGVGVAGNEVGEAVCWRCEQENASPCALFVRPRALRVGEPDMDLPQAVSTMRWKREEVGEALGLCAICQRLLDMTETEAERRFYQLYLEWALRDPKWVLEAGSEDGAEREFAYDPPGRLVLRMLREPELVDREIPGHGGVIGNEAWMICTRSWLLDELAFPALVPQGFMNLVPTGDLEPNDPDQKFYERNVGRVDFVAFFKGERHVIEIDGPVHHSTELAYTRNLRIDRSLRRRGWVVHRFSNREIAAEKSFGFALTEVFWGHLPL